MPVVKSLYSKKSISGTNLLSLNETMTNNVNREESIKAKIHESDEKLRELDSEIEILEFKSKIIEAKIESHEAAVKLLESN